MGSSLQHQKADRSRVVDVDLIKIARRVHLSCEFWKSDAKLIFSYTCLCCSSPSRPQYRFLYIPLNYLFVDCRYLQSFTSTPNSFSTHIHKLTTVILLKALDSLSLTINRQDGRLRCCSVHTKYNWFQSFQIILGSYNNICVGET